MKYLKMLRLRPWSWFGSLSAVGLGLAYLLLAVPGQVKVEGRSANSYRSGEVIVNFKPGTDIKGFLAKTETSVKGRINGTNQYLLQLRANTSVLTKMEDLAKDKSIDFVSPNYVIQQAEVLQRSQAYIDQRSQAYIDGVSPPNYYGQPAITPLHLSQAHQFSTGNGITVAVIDTGIDATHALFNGRLAYPQYDFVEGDAVPQDELGGAGSGHGTFVAGIVALTAPGSSVMPLRAFNREGAGSSFHIASAIRFAADNGARVINMSFGMYDIDPLIEDALNYAMTKSFLVAAGGNDDMDRLHYPAARPEVTLGVVATTATDLRAPFSNYNLNAQVAAPGVDVYSAYPGGLWATWSGTSFSAPLVAGEAAMVLAVKPTLNGAALTTIITTAGVNIDGLNPGYEGKLGHVRIDFLDAVNLALAW